MSQLIYCYAECRYAECHYAECRGAIFEALGPKLMSAHVSVLFKE